MKNTSNRQFGLALIPLVIMAIALAYYLVVFLPSKERMRNDLEKEKIRLETEAQKDKDVKLKECFDTVQNSYKFNWDTAVERLKRKDGTLPSDAGDRLDDFRKNEQDLCVKKYK